MKTEIEGDALQVSLRHVPRSAQEGADLGAAYINFGYDAREDPDLPIYCCGEE